MIIDVHNHPDWHGHDLGKFLANMDRQGIERTWLLSWECPADEYDPSFIWVTSPVGKTGPISFERCLSYVERAPDRFVLGYAPDPRKPEAVDTMRSAIEIYGARVYGELKLRMMYDNPDALRMYRFCGERKVPVLVHIDYELPTKDARRYPRPSYWYGGGIEAFERAISACPETVFIGHGPGFWANISGDDQSARIAYPKGPVQSGGRIPEMLRTYPNLYCDLSAGSGRNAISRDPEFGKKFLLEFQDRILFGRDCFDSGHKDMLAGMQLPPDVLEKILCGNALRLVPLPERSKAK